MSSSPSEHDPHPELPACFSDRTYVEQLVRDVHSSVVGERGKARKTRRFLRKRRPSRHRLASHRVRAGPGADRRNRGVPNDWFGRASAAWFSATSSAHWWPAKCSAAASMKRPGVHSLGTAKRGTGHCTQPTSLTSWPSPISSIRWDTCTTRPRSSRPLTPGHSTYAPPRLVGKDAWLTSSTSFAHGKRTPCAVGGKTTRR